MSEIEEHSAALLVQGHHSVLTVDCVLALCAGEWMRRGSAAAHDAEVLR